MKNVLRLLVFAALVTVFALPAYAQDAAAAGQTPAAAGPCTAEAEAKGALYKKFLELYKGNPDQQKTAFDTGKEYLGKYGNCPDDADKKVASFIQNWNTKYEAATLKFNCTKAVNENPTQAFTLCQPYVDANRDALEPYLLLVAAGLKNAQAKNFSTNTQAANAARRVIQLVEQGKTTTEWAGVTTQAEAVPKLNYYIGYFMLENAPAEAATHMVKAAQSNSPIAKEPSTYEILAAAYYKNEVVPLSAEYKAKCEGKEVTPECEALFRKISAVSWRLADAYARAAALAPAGPAKDKFRTNFETFYKQLHEGKTDGMNEYLANVMSKPIMMPGQEPAPPIPATTTTTTPADGTTTNGTGGTTTTTTPASGATPPKPAATSTPAPTAKPTPTPQKPPRS
ncbi:MAG TPA: hypothetical protein VN282_20970 [Pyrinomonadaceae bacterium]|nr:hypothetical protein [Pyrinomonadaceae bacterium]